jgi:hypothetical protein
MYAKKIIKRFYAFVVAFKPYSVAMKSRVKVVLRFLAGKVVKLKKDRWS